MTSPLSQRNRQLHDLLDPVVQRLKHCVRPLYVFEEGRVPKHIGCGVLLSLSGVRFVLTAGHVLRQMRGQQLVIGSIDRLASLAGRGEYSEPSDGFTIRTDPVDVGVFRISDDCVRELDGCALALSDLDWKEEHTRANYLFIGFPTKRAKVSPSIKNVSPDLVRHIGSGAKDGQYPLIGRNPLTHVAIGFDQQASITEQGIRPIPSPGGASGTGLWRVTIRPALLGGPSAWLVAIFTDHLEQENLLVGTRIIYHFALIRDRWPDFRSIVPSIPYGIRFQVPNP